MSQMKPDLEARITAATQVLAVAEENLRKVLEAMQVEQRAEKRIIAPALQTAFDAVVNARTTLASALEER